VHHLAWGRRDILAQPERVRIGMGQLAALHVGHHVLHSRHQTGALGLNRPAQRHRVGEGRVGWAHRFHHRTHCELDLGLFIGRQIFQRVCRAQHVIGHDLIALPHQIEDGMLPICARKSPVARVELGSARLGERRKSTAPGIQRMLPRGQRGHEGFGLVFAVFGHALCVLVCLRSPFCLLARAGRQASGSQCKTRLICD
jgi:hypothetical protein